MATTNELKVFINAGNERIQGQHKIQSDSLTAGVIIFNEPTKEIWVNGNAYGLNSDNSTKLSNIITTLEANGFWDNNNLNNPSINIIGDFDDFNDITELSTADTITELIVNLQTQISTLSTSVADLQTNLITKDLTNYPNINTVGDIITTTNDAINDIIGVEPDPNNPTIWANGESKTLTHLKALINTLNGGSSTNLETIQNQIDNILAELDAVQGTQQGDALNTILDAYRTLRGTNPLTVNSIEKTTFQDIINALEALISANSTTDQSYADSKKTEVVGNSTSDTKDSPTIYGAKKYTDDKIATVNTQIANINDSMNSIVSWEIIGGN